MSPRQVDRIDGWGGRGPWWRATVGVIVLPAAVVLLGLTWSMARLAWFAETSEFCQTTMCMGWAWEEGASVDLGPDPVTAGQEALTASGMSELTIALGYAPLAVAAFFAVLVLLTVAAVAWWWSPVTWFRHWRGGTARYAVGIAGALAVAVISFAVLYVWQFQTLMWVTNVTE